ncbi:MAG: hypothetical protein Q7O66_16135 [Dehalococcoidia bacterium]|nr:hypothetical protein [Dehalococcoidia bacterium]
MNKDLRARPGLNLGGAAGVIEMMVGEYDGAQFLGATANLVHITKDSPGVAA